MTGKYTAVEQNTDANRKAQLSQKSRTSWMMGFTCNACQRQVLSQLVLLTAMDALQRQHTAHALCLVTDTLLLLVHADHTAHAVSLVTDITLPLVHNTTTPMIRGIWSTSATSCLLRVWSPEKRSFMSFFGSTEFFFFKKKTLVSAYLSTSIQSQIRFQSTYAHTFANTTRGTQGGTRQDTSVRFTCSQLPSRRLRRQHI